MEREINSANDNPLIDPDEGRVYRAGNFYGGHISRALDTWKIDFAVMGNWANALMAVLVDDRFNSGSPRQSGPEPRCQFGAEGGMQLSVTSLACAIRQFAGPSSIHSLPTEQYNQDVVSLGMHSAVTAMDALECLRNEVAMVLLAATQAVDLRGCANGLGGRGIGRRTGWCVKFRRSSRMTDLWRPRWRLSRTAWGLNGCTCRQTRGSALPLTLKQVSRRGIAGSP